MKKLISTIIAAALLFTFSISLFAADTSEVTTTVLSDGTVVKRASVELINNEYATISTYSMSIGTGYVEGEDPLIGKPRAHAVTGAYQGSYRVSAKCDVVNSDASSYTTGWTHEYNTYSAITSTIYAGTSKCTFTGYYEIELTQGGIKSSDQSSLSF